MRKLMYILVFASLLPKVVCAQEKYRFTGDINRIEATLDSLRAAEVRRALKDTSFVIEAEMVSIDGHIPVSVSSHDNFFMVDHEECTLQTAFDVPRSGLNGLGGITLDGNLGIYKSSEDENGSIHLEIGVNGLGSSGSVHILIPPEGNTVRMSFTPTFRSRGVTMSGRLIPKERSEVFKGRSLL